jgi:hypothetical protein
MKKQSEVHLEVKLRASTRGAVGGSVWTALLVLGSLWTGWFIVRLNMEFHGSHRVSAGLNSSLGMESQQRTQLEPVR